MCLGRSPEAIVAILAIVKSGAAYLPIDPLYPQARRAAMIEDARLRLIVTDREVASCLPSGEYQQVLLDAEADAIAASSDEPLLPIAAPEMSPTSSTPLGRPANLRESRSHIADWSITQWTWSGAGTESRRRDCCNTSR